MRNNSLDIAKAICIILMVVGHSGCPTFLHDFVYMFHMPCFFFVSGWLLNDKYITDLKTGLIQKTKGLSHLGQTSCPKLDEQDSQNYNDRIRKYLINN